jgi:predicted ATPase
LTARQVLSGRHYLPVRAAARPAASLLCHPTLPAWAAGETLVRDLYPLLPELVPEPPRSPYRIELEQEKRRLFAVLTTFFTRLAEQKPVLLIVEDVHWSDETSLEFLHDLARHTASRRLLLLVTYRRDETRAALARWQAQLHRERLLREVDLAPLSRDDVDMMLSGIFDKQHSAVEMRRFVHGELLWALYGLTTGNPFFVEETLGALVADGAIFYGQGHWNYRSRAELPIPQGVYDKVQQRTAQLHETAESVLTVAAIVGRHFDFVLLQEITHHDESRLLQIMKDLISAQLVAEESADRFGFRHALTREAIYDGLLTRERLALHRTIVETMERLGYGASEERLGDLAYHYYQAGHVCGVDVFRLRGGKVAEKLAYVKG